MLSSSFFQFSFTLPLIFVFLEYVPPFSATLVSSVNISAQKSSESYASVSKDIRKAVQVYPLNLKHYLEKEI